MNVNFFCEMVKCIILMTLANNMEVRKVSALHVKAPVKSSLGCSHIPTDKSSELHILR